MRSEPEPFTIAIPQADLDDLRDRLRRTRWPEDPGNPDGRYGAGAAWVQDLVHHWAEEFDWRAAEADMNEVDQYRVALDGIPIDAPTGFGVFKKDLVFLPRSEAARLTNLQRWTVFDSGGHFAPVERPDAVVEELREFFRPLR